MTTTGLEEDSLHPSLYLTRTQVANSNATTYNRPQNHDNYKSLLQPALMQEKLHVCKYCWVLNRHLGYLSTLNTLNKTLNIFEHAQWLNSLQQFQIFKKMVVIITLILTNNQLLCPMIMIGCCVVD